MIFVMKLNTHKTLINISINWKRLLIYLAVSKKHKQTYLTLLSNTIYKLVLKYCVLSTCLCQLDICEIVNAYSVLRLYVQKIVVKL